LWVRAIHRAASHALVIGLLLHIARVVAARAYRAPREFVWWGGLAMFGLSGFIAGPAIAALFITAWDMFAREYSPADRAPKGAGEF